MKIKEQIFEHLLKIANENNLGQYSVSKTQVLKNLNIEETIENKSLVSNILDALIKFEYIKTSNWSEHSVMSCLKGREAIDNKLTYSQFLEINYPEFSLNIDKTLQELPFTEEQMKILNELINKKDKAGLSDKILEFGSRTAAHCLFT